jgi:hypothetical protein
MFRYGPLACRIASAKPACISVEALETGATVPPTIEFNDLHVGESHIIDRVRPAKLWKVYEDNTLIAEGNGPAGTREVTIASVRTPYLRRFLALLDDGVLPSPGPPHA